LVSGVESDAVWTGPMVEPRVGETAMTGERVVDKFEIRLVGTTLDGNDECRYSLCRNISIFRRDPAVVMF
jgi:hypothetical protein